MKKFTKFLFVLLLGAISLFASCKKEINEVTFKNVPTTMYVDDSFTVEYSKQDKVTATFVSSNTSVATVVGEKVTAVAAGEFTLTATFSLGKKTKEYTFDIVVKQSTFAVTYENDGSYSDKTNAATYSVKALPIALVNPTKVGYTFAGWYLNDVKVTEIPAGSTGDIKLVAKWDEVSYNINYQLDGGVNNETNPANYTVLENVTLAEATKAGYTFLGWYMNNELVTEIPVGTIGDVEVVAKWEVVNYNIAYNLDGGVNNDVNPSTFTIEDKVELASPTKIGYAFLGWYLNGELVTEIAKGTTGDVELVAAWQADSYNINYHLDGGINPLENPSVFTSEEEVVLLEPIKAGYNFLGWFADEAYDTPLEKIKKGTTNNVEAYAKWEIANYVINYELDGGTNNQSNPATFTIEDEVLFAAPTKSGYDFLGWYSDKAYTVVIEKIEKGTVLDLTVYAKWEKTKVIKTIKYQLDGGVNPDGAPESYVVGEGCKLPVPTKEGYNFLGWTLSKTATTYVTEIAATYKYNATVYAHWEKIKIYSEIVYELNGGQLVVIGDVSKYVEGEEFVLPIPTQDGFKFLGWSLQKDSAEFIKAIPATSTGKVTVYANWEEYQEPVVGEPFTINYELDGGEWAWTTAPVTDAAKGIDAVSNLPEIFMADFYTYLLENNLLTSSKVATKLQVSTWAAFSSPYGDPVAWYNATSTGGYSAADGYSELFFDSVNGYEAVGGFLGTSPYKEKYANLTKHMIQLTTARYATTLPNTKNFKSACGFVLDGYFYGTQGLRNDATFDTLRGLIPTPTVGYEGSVSSENTYVVTEGIGGTELKVVDPVKEGHMFLGWYDNPSFTGEKVTSVKFGCTLYAYWYNLNAPAPTFDIDYVLNEGALPEDAPLVYVQFEGVELPKPIKDGYTFVGWSTDEEGFNTITSIPATARGKFTVYANWVEGELEVYKIKYVYDEGKLPTYNPSSIEDVAEYVFTSYYNWLKPNEKYETFKSKVISQWYGSKSQGQYKFYKENGANAIDDEYFINATENYEKWIPWFNMFDAQVTLANGSQDAWSTWVGIYRLGQVLSGNPPVTWKDSFNETMMANTFIDIPLITEYTVGQSIELVGLTIDDGREFLGWVDENGNKVTHITPNTVGNLVLTATWSISTPVEKVEVSKIDKIERFDSYKLTWIITPSDATNKKVTLSSSDTSVLTIDQDGNMYAVNNGTATITLEVADNPALNVVFDVVVYSEEFIDLTAETETYVKKDESIKLNAKLYFGTGNILWKSLNPSIVTVDELGNVTGVKEGYGEIMAYVEGNETINITMGITVISGEFDEMLEFVKSAHNSQVYVVRDLPVAFGIYYTDVYGSVSDLLFNYDYEIKQDYRLTQAQLTAANRTNMKSIEFITVHYNGMPDRGVNAAKTAKSLYNQFGANYTTCWHYSTGNDGIYQSLDDWIRAAHAGDGTTSVNWADSGVKASSNTKPIYGKSGSYLTINGQISKIALPSGYEDKPLTWYGPLWKVENGNYWIAKLHYDSTYGYIGSYGGNMNSIGIESACDEGSDLWLTYHITAQLVARLLKTHNLETTRVTGHHAFSGKDCPQTLLENDGELWLKFMDLVEAERKLLDLGSNYTITAKSNNPDILGDNGRIISFPKKTTTVSYTVTITNNTTGKSVSETFSSIVEGKYLK